MPRSATAASPMHDEEATAATLDELVRLGRRQGHLSLAELRATFQEAGITAAEGRSILRELAEAGVRLADEAEQAIAAIAPDPVDGAPDLVPTLGELAQPGELGVADLLVPSGAAERDLAEEAELAARVEADLDDETSTMGDSVHTYLKAIGRTSLLTAEQEVDLAKRIEAGLFAEYKLEAESGGLDDGLRAELEAVAADGRRAKAHMLEANLRLVVSVAKKYSDRGLSLLDVVQEGNLGLLRAVEKFDYTKGYKFSTYAMWWIRQAIQRGFADSARTIRLPVHVLEMLSKLSRVERDMHQRLGREPTIMAMRFGLYDGNPHTLDEIGRALGLTRERIRQLEKQSLSKLRHPSRAQPLLDFAS